MNVHSTRRAGHSSPTQNNVTKLYYAKKHGYELLRQGIHEIADIPANTKLGAKPHIQQETIMTGKVHVDDAQSRSS